MAGLGRFDHGTTDTTFGLPPGTLGFDPNFMKIFPKESHGPADGGQYGFAVRTFIPQLNSAELGMYFLNYHSRFALINGFTADQTAIDATSSTAVAARAAQLAPIYQAEGLSRAPRSTQAAAGTLTIGKFANATRYFASYPENIKMLGFSFNTAMLRTGTLFSGEISHHLGFPVQRPVEQVLAAALSPIRFTPVFGQTPLGTFGANTVVRGFEQRDKTQLELGLRQLLGPQLYSSQTVLGLDLGWVHIHNLPASSHSTGLLGLSAHRPVDVRRRLRGVTPPVWCGEDVNGVTPGPVERRRTTGL
jgi:hypothetical protein